jgi:hypothetical protein
MTAPFPHRPDGAPSPARHHGPAAGRDRRPGAAAVEPAGGGGCVGRRAVGRRPDGGRR